MAHKEREGWTYGETKDAKKKTHPNLVPFYQLPIQERMKDIMFIYTATMGILTFEPGWGG